MSEILEFTPYQKNLWNMNMAMEHTAICNLGGYIYSESMTDYEVWQEVMRSVLKKCSVLRFEITPDGHQRTTDYKSYELPYYDRRGKSKEEIIAEMQGIMGSDADVTDVSLCDCRYILSDCGMYMFGRFNHLTMDGVSFVMLMKRMEQVYTELEERGTDETEADDLFLQECKEKHGHLRAEKMRAKYKEICQSEVRQWKARPVLKRTDRAGLFKMTVPETLDKTLKEFSKRQRVSVETLLFAAGAILLESFGGYGEALIGRSVINREHSQLKSMGMYVNTQAVRIETTCRSVENLLKETGRTLMDLMRRSGYSFSDWKKDAGLDGGLFDLVISYRSARFLPKMERAEIRELANLSMEIPICLKWNEEETETEAVVLYCVQGWEQKDAQRFLERMFYILEQMTERPDQEVSSICPCCEADMQVMEQMKGMDWEYVNSVPEQFVEQISQRQDEIIIEDESGVLTGRELILECACALDYIDAHIGNREGLIGLAVPRSRHLPVLMMASVIAGHGFLPVNEHDSEERRESISNYCALMLTEAELNEILLCMKHTEAEMSEELKSEEHMLKRLAERASQADRQDIAYAISTSGTTGTPKITLNTQEGLACRLAWMRMYFGEGGRYLQKTRKTFDVSVWVLLLPLVDYGQMFVAENTREADVAYLAALINEKQITKVHFVPSVLRIFLKYAETEQMQFPKLMYLFSSGEALTPELAAKARQILPYTKIYNLYGPAECAIDVSMYECVGGETQIPIGKAVPGTALYVLNPNGQKVPPGIEGEICITGKQVGIGYASGSASEKDREKFFRLDGENAYRTGDRGRYNLDGQLLFLGRIDRETKIRGMRIDLGTVETELGRCPGVLTVAVCKERDRLLAFYVTNTKTESDMREWAKKYLPDYSVPDMFIRKASLPVEAHGKLDRKKIAEFAKTALKEDTKKLPSESVEKMKNILKPYIRGEIQSTDSVFAAGLTSLGTAEFVLDLNQAGFLLTYQDVYRAQSLEAMCRLAEQRLTEQRTEEEEITVLRRHAEPEQIFVCFPYAGGGAECFERFSEGFADAHVQVWVAHGVFQTEEKGGINTRILEAICAKIPPNTPIHVMGYCGGASAVFAFLDVLNKMGKNAETLWLCAAYPYKNLRIMDNEYTLWDILPKRIGVKMVEKIYGGKILFDKQTYATFRKEIRQSQRYMRSYQGVCSLPTFLIYGENDPLTANYEKTYQIYHRYIRHKFTVCKIPGAGHYFMEAWGRKLGHYARRKLDSRIQDKRNEV